MKTIRIVMTSLALTMLVVSVGCNEREAQIAREAADRQARQNEQMAQVANQVAEGSKKLVEADAQARKEIVLVHRDLQTERAVLGDQWNKLETERQDIAQDRRTESMLVPALQTIGAIAVAALAIGFCLSLLYGLRKNDNTDAQLGELLVHEIVEDQPRLLPPREWPALPRSEEATLAHSSQPHGAEDDRHEDLSPVEDAH